MKTSKVPSKTAGQVYKASVKFLYLILVIILVCDFYLVRMGLSGLREFPAEAEDPFRFIAGFMPIIVAVFATLLVLGLIIANFRRKIGINASHFVYSGGRKVVKMLLSQAVVSTPHTKKRLFDATTISDGSSLVQFERIFFPDYDEICKIISERKELLSSRSSNMAI